jgi:hypothetical protein
LSTALTSLFAAQANSSDSITRQPNLASTHTLNVKKSMSARALIGEGRRSLIGENGKSALIGENGKGALIGENGKGALIGENGKGALIGTNGRK